MSLWRWLFGPRTTYTIRVYCPNCIRCEDAVVKLGTLAVDEKILCPNCHCETARKIR
jgi:hypothetical protein